MLIINYYLLTYKHICWIYNKINIPIDLLITVVFITQRIYQYFF